MLRTSSDMVAEWSRMAADDATFGPEEAAAAAACARAPLNLCRERRDAGLQSLCVCQRLLHSLVFAVAGLARPVRADTTCDNPGLLNPAGGYVRATYFSQFGCSRC